MPRVYNSIALAASSNRRSQENRVTELVGTVLEGHLGFANRLLDRLKLPSVDQVEVWSQVSLGSDGRLDLVLRGRGANGPVVVYFEHKEPSRGAAWQPGQPGKYVNALRDEARAGASGKLLVIAAVQQAEKRVRSRMRRGATGSAIELAADLREGTAATDRPLIEYATWQEIAGLAFEAGQEVAGGDRDWLAKAEAPDAAASQRLLAELIWYLEEEGYSMTKALDARSISAARGAFDLIESLDWLTKDVGERITAREAGLGVTGIRGASDTFRAPRTSWVERFGGRLYTGWDEARDAARAVVPSLDAGELIFIVGAYVDSAGLKVLERKPDWAEHATSNGLYIEDGDVLAAYDAKKLQDYETLDQQGDEIARWATDRLRAILELKPGRAPAKPAPKASRKKAAPRRKLLRRS
jgi:hypothetical protein